MTGSWLQVLDGAGLPPEALDAAIVAAMADARVLRIRGVQPVGEPLVFWRARGETLGRGAVMLEDSRSGAEVPADGGWMDVRFEPDRLDTYRHANVGQPLHTDGAYSDHDQDIGLFYLARQARAGGESLFIDAESLASRLAERDPDLLSALLNTPLRFGKAGAAKTCPVLRHRDGRLKVNWNSFRVLPDQGEAAARLHESFRLFLERLVEEGTTAAFRLETGDAVFFRDDEVLHGRKSYAATSSGDRLLWKTYFISPAAEGRRHAA
jgi:alpha-ketoglutarate-dependent taurine dioxygenase